MKENKNGFNPDEQIRVIREMIEKTKKETAEDGWSYIMWGWLILAACVSNYFISIFWKPEFNWLPWAIFMFAGVVISFIVEGKRSKKSGVKTYAERAISWLWIGCGGSMFFIGFVAKPAGIIQSWESITPLICMFAGVGSMVTAKIVEWKLAFYLSLLWFAAVIVMIFINPVYYLIVLGITIIPAYLVPGYILRNKYKKA